MSEYRRKLHVKKKKNTLKNKKKTANNNNMFGVEPEVGKVSCVVSSHGHQSAPFN